MYTEHTCDPPWIALPPPLISSVPLINLMLTFLSCAHIRCNTHTHTHALCVYISLCGGLNILGPESGTIWRYGLVGVGVALLEWVCHCGHGISALILVSWKPVISQWLSNVDVELSATPAPCLPWCCHALMIMQWISEPVCQPQLNFFFIRVVLVMLPCVSNANLN